MLNTIRMMTGWSSELTNSTILTDADWQTISVVKALADTITDDELKEISCEEIDLFRNSLVELHELLKSRNIVNSYPIHNVESSIDKCLNRFSVEEFLKLLELLQYSKYFPNHHYKEQLRRIAKQVESLPEETLKIFYSLLESYNI